MQLVNASAYRFIGRYRRLKQKKYWHHMKMSVIWCPSVCPVDRPQQWRARRVCCRAIRGQETGVGAGRPAAANAGSVTFTGAVGG